MAEKFSEGAIETKNKKKNKQ